MHVAVVTPLSHPSGLIARPAIVLYAGVGELCEMPDVVDRGAATKLTRVPHPRSRIMHDQNANVVCQGLRELRADMRSTKDK